MSILVSAFYTVENSYDDIDDKYIEYINNFIPYIKNKMILFVESKQLFMDLMNKHNIFLRNNIIIVEKSIEYFLVSNHKYDWITQHNIDPDKSKHCINLYKIQNEKANFMKLAADMYPLINNYYVWVNIDIIKNKQLRPFVRYLSDKEINKDKIYILRTTKKYVACHNNNLDHELVPIDTQVIKIDDIFSSTIIAGHIDVIHKYYTLYYEIMNIFLEQKIIFVGNGQNIIFDIVSKYPNIINLIDYTSNNWMHAFQSDHLLFMFNYLITEKRFVVCNPVRGGLANVLFAVCSSYGYAIKTNRVFFLIGDAISNHSKINYTNTLFRYFTKINNNIIQNVKYMHESRYDTYMGDYNDPDKNYHLITYLQNEKYFISHREDILQALEILYKISGENKYDYFIHNRRGDYINNPYHYIDLNKYFDKSIDYIKEKDIEWKTKKFCVVSDDIYYCKNTQFMMKHNLDLTYIENKNETETLSIMINAQNGGIASNSTYSWWGLWLNKNPNSIKILPSKWLNLFPTTNIYFSGSHIIEV